MVLNGLINVLTSQSALHVKLTNLATELLKQKSQWASHIDIDIRFTSL
jgi:hypothetical protein